MYVNVGEGKGEGRLGDSSSERDKMYVHVCVLEVWAIKKKVDLGEFLTDLHKLFNIVKGLTKNKKT